MRTILQALGLVMAVTTAWAKGPPLNAGDTCELVYPMVGKAGKARKVLPKGSRLTVVEFKKKLAVVRAGSNRVLLNADILQKACTPVTPSPIPPAVATPPAAAAANAPTAVETGAPASGAAAPTPSPQVTDANPQQRAPAAPTGVSADPATNTVVVTTLKAAGVTAEEALLVTNKVTEHLANTSSYHVVSLAELSAMTDYHKELGELGCDGDSCMAQLAKMANAGLAITGSVGKVGTQIVISLSLINVDASKSIAAGTASLASIDGLDAALPKLCEQMLGTGGAAAAPQYRLPEGKKVSFAVFDLKAQGISEDAARNLTQLLAVEIKKVEGTTVVSRDDINAMLQMQQTKDSLGCDSVACLAEIGGALGVDNLIVGDVGKVADRFIVTLRLLDVRNSNALGRVNETFEGQEDQLLGAVRQAGRRLIGVDHGEPGGLAIATSQPMASVFLDGEIAGDSPLPPLKALPTGRHSVRVSKDGFLDWRSDVFVEAGNTTALWSDLVEAPQKWYQKWWVWSIVGGVATVGTGAGLYFSQSPPTTG